MIERLVMVGLAIAVMVSVVIGSFAAGSDEADLVIYCAHDSIHSEALIRDFESETGLRVQVLLDSEASKSLGLTERLVREADNPRCDVFWNNQLLGTMDLAARGLLQPYRGSGWRRMPAAVKDADGLWTGFAARIRVWLVDTRKIAADEGRILTLWQTDPQQLAMAKPLYGTTLSHLTALWARDGAVATQRWHNEAIDKGLRIVNGNSITARLVARGAIAAALTDSDDALVQMRSNPHLRMIPARIDGKVLCLPNAISLVKGARNAANGQIFIDWLLAENQERALAFGSARQIPLAPTQPQDLPPEVLQLAAWAQDAVDLRPLAQARGDCLQWLKQRWLQ